MDKNHISPYYHHEVSIHLLIFKVLWHYLSPPMMIDTNITNPLPPYDVVIDYGAGDINNGSTQYLKYAKRFKHLFDLMDNYGLIVISPKYINSFNIDKIINHSHLRRHLKKALDRYHSVLHKLIYCLFQAYAISLKKINMMNSNKHYLYSLQSSFLSLMDLQDFDALWVLLHLLHQQNRLQYVAIVLEQTQLWNHVHSNTKYQFRFISILCNLWMDNKMSDNSKNPQRSALITQSIIYWRDDKINDCIAMFTYLSDEELFDHNLLQFIIDFVTKFHSFHDSKVAEFLANLIKILFKTRKDWNIIYDKIDYRLIPILHKFKPANNNNNMSKQTTADVMTLQFLRSRK